MAHSSVAPIEKDLLRFITCGSVDDGKSTLIGRLLHDVGAVPDDQVAALKGEDGELDFSLLVDGLLAEREQGITIDVAYRYFSSGSRQFIVADTPGHEQYTRNMATGASTADAAVVLVDARKGIMTQTRRHSHIVAMLGVRHVIVAVTKMDMIDWSQQVFDAIAEDYQTYAAEAGLPTPILIPVSGKQGDNLVRRSTQSPWYTGPSLIETLENLPLSLQTDQPFRMAVQGINRPNLDFRGYMGRINSGTVRPGDEVVVAPSGVRSKVARIVTMDGDLDQASAGQSVTLTLADEVDIARGDILAAGQSPVEAADQFEATLIWMAETEMIPGRLYDLKIGARTVPVQITDIRHRINVNTQEKLSARTLELNDIGVCHLSLGHDIGFEPYEVNRDLGGFILIDRLTRATVGAGLLHFALRRAHNIHRQAVKVDRQQRAALKGHQPAIVWFTGLSGAGKSTIANQVEEELSASGLHTYLIDGDNLRHGLSRDLGFTEADRVENIRRAAEVAAMMADAGLIVLVSLISPFRADRAMARDKAGQTHFLEVFVDAPLDMVESRDIKGLYAKARRGEIKNFTGIDSPYEAPSMPEVHLRADQKSVGHMASTVLDAIRAAVEV